MTVRRILLIVAALAGMALTASLGRWQLSRAAERQALHDAEVAAAHLPPLPGAALAQADSDAAFTALLHRRIRLQGQWVADRTVYLDNRQMDRQSGFYVVTPLRLSDGPVVLVVRGWAARDFDARKLPRVQTPAGPVEVNGELILRPAPTFALGQESTGPIRQNLDLAAFRLETGLPLAPVMVQQTGAPSDGLMRDWPEPSSGVATNYGYAAQWFGLCALIGVLFVWFQVVRPSRSSPPDAAHD